MSVKSVFNKTLGTYSYIIHDLGDPRTRNWFPISNPTPTLIVIGFYLVLVYKILPTFMRSRAPYNLDRIIRWYNIYQIIACATMVYQIATPLAAPSYVLKCEYFDYSETSERRKRLNLSYYFYLIKVTELAETLFFILRKKFNQVSTLHVYHHVTTLMMAWFFAKYFAGGMVSFCMMLNSFVHVVMYSYYLCASLGPEWQKTIAKWKSGLTMLQMVQLFILIAHSSQVLFRDDCGLPAITFYVYAPNVAVMFYMFRNFYKKNYGKVGSKKVT